MEKKKIKKKKGTSKLIVSENETINTLTLPSIYADPRRMKIMNFVKSKFKLIAVTVKFYGGIWLDVDRTIADLMVGGTFQDRIPARVGDIDLEWAMRIVKETKKTWTNVEEYIKDMEMLKNTYNDSVMTFDSLTIQNITSQCIYRLVIKGILKRKSMIVWTVNHKRIDKITQLEVAQMLDDFSVLMKEPCHYTPIQVTSPIVCPSYIKSLMEPENGVIDPFL